jgi:hypothetical protein
MDVKAATFLYTLAGLMITFAGFSALLLSLRPAAGARLLLLDRFLAKTVMSHITTNGSVRAVRAALAPRPGSKQVSHFLNFPVFAGPV